MNGSFSGVMELDADAPVNRPEPIPVVPPVPASSLTTGQRVWIVFWRSSPMPDGHDIGGGDFTPARVIFPGPEKVCIAPDNPHLPLGFGDDADSPEHSPVRFADPANVYSSRDEAVRAIVLMKPPPPARR